MSVLSPAALAALAKGDIENAMIAATPGGIEKQEKQGQIEQSFLETLPIEGSINNRAAWEALGFLFGEMADDIFVNVKFPEGWRKLPGADAYLTAVLDAKGRKRAEIFYKAAFYDRHANVFFRPRFSVARTYENAAVDFVFVEDAMGVVKERRGPFPSPSAVDRGNDDEYRNRYGKIQNEMEELRAWLRAKYPDYEDPANYWDESEAVS